MATDAPRRLIGYAAGAALCVATLVSASAPAAADSFTGAYLAARHAAVNQDVEAAARYYRRALHHAPDAEDLLEPALIYSVAAGDVARGAALASRLVRSRPEDDRIASLVLSAEALSEGRFIDARERANIADAGGAVGLLSELLGAWAALGAGGADAALEALSEPEDSALIRLFNRYHAGLLAAIDGDDEAAVKAFQESIDAAGGASSRLARALGGSYERLGRIDHAPQVYADALERNGDDSAIRAELKRLQAGEPAALMVSSARDGAAEAFYGLAAALTQDEGARFGLIFAQLALHLRPDLDDGRILIGDIFDDMKQYGPAAEAFGAVDETSPLYGLAQLGRASALDRMDRDEEALGTLRSLIDRSPDQANVYFAIGEFFSRHERFEECVAAYDAGMERLEKTLDRHWIVHYGRGICLERTDNWPRAEENFTRALELRPDQPDVLNYLGYSLVEMNERLEEARKMIERAVEKRPDSGYIVDSLGWVLYRLGDYDGAVKHLEEAVRLSPVEPVITDHLGDALWMVGRKMEARFQWRRALSFDPEPKDEARIRRKLDIGLDRVIAEESAGGAPLERDASEPGLGEGVPDKAEAPSDGTNQGG